MKTERELLADAVCDLTRVILALQGNFPSRADAVRKLLTLSIPPVRVAKLLGVDVTAVTAIVAKDKKRNGRSRTNARV